MFHRPVTTATTAGTTPPPTPLLSPIERQVVMLALREEPATICPGGALRRLADLLFGVRRANPLADPRLEALRRFCIGRRLRCSDARRASVIAECVRWGLTEDELTAAATLSDLASASKRGAWA